jgi:outer membrane protein
MFERIPLSLLLCLMTGCSAMTPYRQSPPSADRPYADPRIPTLASTEKTLSREVELPPAGEALSLTRLIALAQNNNRSTHLAWQQARAAAAATGLSAAEYYPLLVVLASYGGGYMDFQTSGRNNLGGALAAANPVPGTNALVNEATGTGMVLEAGLGDTYTNFLSGSGLRWLLFDFGGRDHRHRAAVSDQLAANLRFNNAHQKLTFSITELYFALQSALRQQEAARVSARAARDVLAAAQARFDRGLLTEPELLQAKSASAEAEFAAVTANSSTEIARVNLATAAGIPPGHPFRAVPVDFQKMSSSLHKPVDDHVRSALRERADLLAQVAVVQAAEARLRAARAERLPTLALEAVALYNQFSPSTNHRDAITQVQQQFQNYGGFLTVQWPIFSGFAEHNKVRLAQAAAEAAREEMQLLREQVIADVWKAYVQAKNALASREAAVALQAASESSYQASLAGFKNGLVPVQEILTTRAAQAQASALVVETEAAIAQSLVNLARSSGKL